VNVSAKDKMTGLEQAMQITPSSGLAPDEIDRLIMESEKSGIDDREAKETILQRNRLETLLRNTQKAMQEYGGSLPVDKQGEVINALTQAAEALQSNDLETIRRSLMEIETAASVLTEALMSAT
jgi:molecular chaperone DnaK